MGKLEGCLLAHTQPRIDPLKDNISKSLWTEMMREVISQVRKKGGAHFLYAVLIYFLLRFNFFKNQDFETYIKREIDQYNLHIHKNGKNCCHPTLSFNRLYLPFVKQRLCQQISSEFVTQSIFHNDKRKILKGEI